MKIYKLKYILTFKIRTRDLKYLNTQVVGIVTFT